MKISIDEINKAILEVFDDTQILSVDSVYEKIDGSDDLKLVIFLNKLYYKTTNVLYTKLLFVVDDEKKYVIKNEFLYLYDINCLYKSVIFEDIDEFKKKIKDIFKKEKFGKNIKILSDFLKNPAALINEWFSKNDVNEISVYGFKYDPKVSIIPCKYLSFNFDINISNKYDIELNITKEKDGLYRYDFKIIDKFIHVEKNNLTTLVETIGDVLKNNII